MSDFFLTLLTHPGCHLCEQAEPVVVAVAERFGAELRVVNIDSDDDLLKQYSLRVPVVLDREGEVLVEGKIERGDLRRQTRRARRRSR